MDESISNFKGVWCTFSLFFYFEQTLLLVNSEDPDETPRAAASDRGLHCLPISKEWGARLTWVKFDYDWRLQNKKFRIVSHFVLQ